MREITYIVEFNPDMKKVKEVKELIKKNKGYCLNCTIKERDTKCMCKQFRNQQFEGLCKCGLYYKKKIYKDTKGN